MGVALLLKKITPEQTAGYLSIGLNSSVFELWSKGMACPGDYIIDMDDGLFPQRKPG